MITDLAAWALGIYLIVSGCCFLRLHRTTPAIGQTLAWAQGSIAAGVAVIGLAVRHPGLGQWQMLAVAVGAFIAAGALISGLLKSVPGQAAVSRQYTNTLPALAALVAILTCTVLAVFAPINVSGAALGLLAVFAAVAARLSLTISSRDLRQARLSAASAYGMLAVSCVWLGIALLSPAEGRFETGLMAGTLLTLSIGWALGQRLAAHLSVINSEGLLTGLPNQKQIDRFLGDYFRHKEPEGVILLKFAVADVEHARQSDGESLLDHLFKDVGSVLQQNFRADDFVAATAGRQFLVACPGLQPDIAQALAERACQAVKRATFKDCDGDPINVALLVGASSICESLPDCERGWQQADIELLGARHAGA